MMSPGLLALPGWDDDGREQFEALKDTLRSDGWICLRARLPDSSWSAKKRGTFTREDAFRQALDDFHQLQQSLGGGPIAVLGFSFGAYIGACLTAARPVKCLALRSPAIYPDHDWTLPKEALDKRDMAEYRQETHQAPTNIALAACAVCEGDVLLIDSEKDQVIPKPVISSYEAAFQHARSVTRYTIRSADHQLTNPCWRKEYHDLAVKWLNEHILPRYPLSAEPSGEIGC